MTTASTSTTRSPSAPPGRARPAGLTGAAGGLAFVVLGLVGIAAGTADGPRAPGFDPWMGVAALACLLLGVGIVGAARLGGVARGALGRAGLVLALAGTAVFAAAHAVAAVAADQDESPLFPIGQTVAALGMVLLGVAVLRRGQWRGAGRATPLVCGLYPFVVLMPAFAIFGTPDFPAIAGFGLCWALLGAATATSSAS